MTTDVANYFLLPISKGEVFPLTLKCMTTDFVTDFSPAHQQGASPTQPNSSELLQILQTIFSCPSTRVESYPPKCQVHDSRCCKRLFSRSLVRGESNPLKLKCMTPDVSNNLSPTHHKVTILPTSTQVHYSKCFNLLFTFPSARGESYPPKFKCMIPDVANDFSPAH